MNSRAAPCSSTSRSIRASIRACTVTSSAVVGSSQISRRGSAGERDGEHRPAGAGRPTAGTDRRAPSRSGSGSSTWASSSTARAVVASRRRWLVQLHRLGDLCPTRISGLSALIGSWNTIDADRAAQRGRAPTPRRRSSPRPPRRTLPLAVQPVGQEAHDRQRGQRLAAARLADQPDALAAARRRSRERRAASVADPACTDSPVARLERRLVGAAVDAGERSPSSPRPAADAGRARRAGRRRGG